jgi:hypothetical protein
VRLEPWDELTSSGAATVYKNDRFDDCFSCRKELNKMGRLKDGTLVRIWKKLAMGYLKALSPGDTEDNHENPQSR